ncbi:MAG: hypothetical protein P8179_15825 [Candidatus Thiodiazotropha sp.]
MNTTAEYPRLIRQVPAVLVDSLLLGIVVFSWWGILPAMDGLPVYIKVGYPIFWWFLLDPLLVTLTGETIGHRLRGLLVQRRLTPDRLGIIGSIVRAVLKVATGWWSFIFVLATQNYQALHDLTVGFVVNKLSDVIESIKTSLEHHA